MTEQATDQVTITGAAPSVQAAGGYFAPLSDHAGRLSAADRAELVDLVFRFEWCFDTRQYDVLTDMLTADAVVDHVWGYREGRDQFVALLRDWEHANSGLRHQSTNLVVWGEPDGTAAAMSYMFAATMTGPLTGDDAGPAFQRPAGHGLVTDRFRREPDGIWRMTRRTIDQMYVDPVFLPNEQARRWFVLSAAERMNAPDKPPGWLPPA